MGVSVDQLLTTVGVRLGGDIAWRDPVPCNRAGIYFVVWPFGQNEHERGIPLCHDVISLWLANAPALRLDKHSPTRTQLEARLSACWLPREEILYIGQTGDRLSMRIPQFYRHTFGASQPHCGGSWIFTLSILNRCRVYWAPVEQPREVERHLLETFMDAVSHDQRALLYDPTLPLPYANLEVSLPQGKRRKRHGITRWKQPKT